MKNYLTEYSMKILSSLFLCFLMSTFVSGQIKKAKVHTTDIDNFWQAYDSVQTTDDRERQIEFMQILYIDKGAEGLKAFMKLRNFDTERLVKTITEYPRFWKSIRPNTFLVKEKETEINRYLEKFQKLYPNYREA